MNKVLAIMIGVASALPIAAHGAVSDDLVFCSKLTNARERIACYDAAARIAAKPASARSQPQPATAGQSAPTQRMQTAPAAARETVAPLPFAGFYAAIGGSYGHTQSREFYFADIFKLTRGELTASGASAIGALGYNIQSGDLVIGVELAGRFGRESGTFSEFVPSFVPNTRTFAYNYDASVHGFLRAGLASGDTLVFARAGAGLTHYTETLQTTGGGFGPVLISTDEWLPSLIFGLGIEQNFGRAFVRAGVDAEGVAQTRRLATTNAPSLNNPITGGSEFFWTARAMAAAGVRF